MASAFTDAISPSERSARKGLGGGVATAVAGGGGGRNQSLKLLPPLNWAQAENVVRLASRITVRISRIFMPPLCLRARG
ncbi:hypothetical protein AL013_01005 [Mariprofundus ferrooxydans]|nr:hypothetical protein AL013_01005 [Mariprofundus ferrooxydans]